MGAPAAPAPASSRLVVTLLYVPADAEGRTKKALESDADVVIVDLEDAVAPSAKPGARAALGRLLRGWESRPVQVRVNGIATPWGRDDLAAVKELPSQVEVRLPKVESVDAVEKAASVLGTNRRVHCLLESALGVERAFEIARHRSAASIGLGEEDLRSNLGVADDRGLDWARSRIVVAARAARLPPPAQSVYTDLDDHRGLEASCRAGRALGFVGRCAIHPNQLPVIRGAYRPGADEVGRARALLRGLDEARASGSGAITTGGRFVDAAMEEGARRILALETATRPAAEA